MGKVVSIQNLVKRHHTFVLSHQKVCVKLGRCECYMGAPKALHLPANGRLKGLPVEYLEADGIKDAKDSVPPKIRVVVYETGEVASDVSAKDNDEASDDERASDERQTSDASSRSGRKSTARKKRNKQNNSSQEG